MAGPADIWVESVEGNFPALEAVLDVLPEGSNIVSAEKHGPSSWTETEKLSVELASGCLRRYFFKGARVLAEGEFYSASTVKVVVPGLVPEPAGWGEYQVGDNKYFFFLGDYHDMDLSMASDPVEFSIRLADFHRKSTSPNGMFGFHVPTVIGKMERTVTWERSWAASFTPQLRDVIGYDNQTNGPWPKYDGACEKLTKAGIPRLLGALQSDGLNITPSLIDGDLWENNVGIDRETGETVIFDPGCAYAHNDMLHLCEDAPLRGVRAT